VRSHCEWEELAVALRVRLVDVIEKVFQELGAVDNHPVHRSVFNPIIERRWHDAGHTIVGDFGQEVSAELHRHSSDSARWKQLKLDDKETAHDLFVMHGEGYWSMRPRPTLDML
jgi:hypothetical protein